MSREKRGIVYSINNFFLYLNYKNEKEKTLLINVLRTSPVMICYCLLRKPNRRCCVSNLRHVPSSLPFQIMMKACNCACAFVLVPLFFLYVYLVLLRWQMFPLYVFHFFFRIRKQFNPVLFFLQRQLLLQNKALSFNGDVPLLSSSSLNVHTYVGVS